MGWLDLFRREWTQERFAALVMRRLTADSTFIDPSYDAGGFRCRFTTLGGGAQTFNLHNAFADFCKAPRNERTACLEKYLLAFSSQGPALSVDEELAALMPVIRDRWTYDYLALSLRAEKKADQTPDVPHVPFAGSLVIALVIDSEHAVATVNQAKLDAWGLDFPGALARARENLRDRSDMSFRTDSRGAYLSAWRDIFDASRVLLPDLFHRLEVDGDPVAILASRNDVFVTGSRDGAGIERSIEHALEVLENDTRPLDDQLLVLRDGTWHPFHTDHPASLKLRQYRRMRIAAQYGEQKALLEKIFDAEGTDLFVATQRVVEGDEGGEPVTLTQWSRDVRALLPLADRLVLFPGSGGECLVVTWEKAEAVLGTFAAESGYYPDRFLVDGYPTDAQLADLKIGAVRTWIAS